VTLREHAPSGFDRWNAGDYLAQYYARVEADEAATLDFITRACGRLTKPGRALVFGIGPTVHHLLPLAPHVREIHVADYLASNLEHVRRWLRRDRDAHDWRPFARHVLECEGVRAPNYGLVGEREDLVRSRVTRCLRGDAGRPSALSTPGLGCYDVVLSCFCAESATGDQAVWRRYVRNILRLLAPGGLFITAALRRCRAYRVGSHRFACADIDEHDLAAVLVDSGIDAQQLQLEVRSVDLFDRLGYDSIVLASGTRPACAACVPTAWPAQSSIESAHELLRAPHLLLPQPARQRRERLSAAPRTGRLRPLQVAGEVEQARRPGRRARQPRRMP
jgi:SAM-dependent methyltransferase